jgi:hypothetical protein
MSRSRKRSQHFSPCKGPNDSDKFDKLLSHRAFRRRAHIAVQTGDFENLPIKLTEGRNIYSFVSDGPKRYRSSPPSRLMRK